MKEKKWIRLFMQEWSLNLSLKSKLIVGSYRISSLFYKKNIFYKIIIFPFLISHYAIVEWLWGLEIKPKTKIGWNLQIYHPVGIIINADAILGCDCIIRHGITIGNKYNRTKNINSKNPIIGNNVELGACCCIIGDIRIGDNCIIGANAFVDFDMTANSKAYAHRAIVK